MGSNSEAHALLPHMPATGEVSQPKKVRESGATEFSDLEKEGRGKDGGARRGEKTFAELLDALSKAHQREVRSERAQCERLQQQNATLRAALQGSSLEGASALAANGIGKGDSLAGDEAEGGAMRDSHPSRQSSDQHSAHEGEKARLDERHVSYHSVTPDVSVVPSLNQKTEVDLASANGEPKRAQTHMSMHTEVNTEYSRMDTQLTDLNAVPQGRNLQSTCASATTAERNSEMDHMWFLGSKFQIKKLWEADEGMRKRKTLSVMKSPSTTSAFIKQFTDTEQETTLYAQNKFVHLFVIHPGSTRRLFWDVTGTLLLAYDIVSIPFITAFNPPPTSFGQTIMWLTMLFWSADIVASFLTGYHTGKFLVMRPSMIAKRYVKSWFPLDVLIVSLDWVFVMIDRNNGDDDTGSGALVRLGRSLRTLRFVRTLRLIRLFKMKKMMQEIQDQINTEALSLMFGIARIILCLVMANHIVACIWFGIGCYMEDGPPNDEGFSSWLQANKMATTTIAYKYTTSLHWSLTQFTPASMEVVPVNAIERSFSVLVLLSAMITFSSFVSVLTASMVELRKMSSDETRQFWLLRRYLRDWKVNRPIALKVKRHLEFLYQRQVKRVQAADVSLLKLLSGPLREELRHAILHVNLIHHPLFKACDERTLWFSKAVSELNFARGEAVFTCGEQAKSMVMLATGCLQYIIGSWDGEGKVKSRTRASQVMKSAKKVGQEADQWDEDEEDEDRLKEDQWASEAILWTSWVHLGDLYSLKECQLVMIDAKQFGEAIDQNKPMWLSIRKYAEQFVEQLNLIPKGYLTDLLHTIIKPEVLAEEVEFTTYVLKADEVEEVEIVSLAALRRAAYNAMVRPFRHLRLFRRRSRDEVELHALQ